LDFVVLQTLNGLASASSLFLVAAGLSIIFGVTRVVNFAHGSLYMLGAYFAVTVAKLAGLGFWPALVLAPVGVALAGAAIELGILRRIYGSTELFPLLATFGVVLIVHDLVPLIWGPADIVGPRAPGLEGAVIILGGRFPAYDLFLIALGPAVLAGLWLAFHRTRWGVLIRAATDNRVMVGALGVNTAALYTGVFMLGAALAGLGGALQLPREPVNHGMDLAVIVEAFVVVVVGGMGSVAGAFLAAIVIKVASAFGIALIPESSLVLMFAIMALVLIVRPQGLLGRREDVGEHGHRHAASAILPPGRGALAAAGLALAALAAAPAVLETHDLMVLAEILIFMLFAASLHLIMGPGGMVSFGHAAYFGLGAYGVALAMDHLGTPMELGLLAGLGAAAAGGLLVGWFSVRLSGVYLAMLTLAFAQILFAAATQWIALTGGDDGILGLARPGWATGPVAFYYVAAAACTAGILALLFAALAPFGLALRAVRDAPHRAAASGIDGGRQQWFAFAAAGLFAGLAGGLYAALKTQVFPDVLSVDTSVDALAMVLLGGLETLVGPVVGAGVFQTLRIALTGAVDLWQMVLGVLIVAMVLAFPQGLVGFVRAGRR